MFFIIATFSSIAGVLISAAAYALAALLHATYFIVRAIVCLVAEVLR